MVDFKHCFNFSMKRIWNGIEKVHEYFNEPNKQLQSVKDTFENHSLFSLEKWLGNNNLFGNYTSC